MLVTPMKLARQTSALLLWAATLSRGLFAQQLPSSPDKFQLRGVELRYVLAERRPKWSVQNRDGSGLWRDRIGIAWVDAYNDSVWIYAAQLAQEAVALGFNEVQFDYVRFPDEPKEAMAQAVFAARKHGETQREGVQAGIAILTHRIQPLGVPVSFDIFGLTSSATGDLGIGQVWEDFVTGADVVLPMVYPSHS